MITYIKEYILENKSVAIRGLGRLELAYREAEIHPICQDFTPPGKYLSFHADENESGEEFCSYVAGKADVSPEEAQQRIVRWVEEVNAALEAGGKYELGSMGRFVRGNVGLNFEPALDPEFSAESFGLNTFSLREERKELFEQKTETQPQPEIEPEPQPVKKVEPQAVKETIAETKPEAETELEAETEPAVQEEMKEETGTVVLRWEKPKRHVGKIICYTLLIFLLCTVIAAGVYAVLRPDEFVQKKDYCISRVTSLFGRDTASVEEVFPEEPKTDDWYVEPDEEVPEDGVSAGEEETAVEETVSAAVEKPAVHCYVIVGGFGNPANADNLVRSLKGKYPNACNLGLNERGTLTMVGIGPYTRAEAESKSQELSATYKDCWILDK